MKKRYLYVDEILEDIQNSENPIEFAKEIVKIKPLIVEILSYNFDKKKKFDLPEGLPEFKQMEGETYHSYEHLFQKLRMFRYLAGEKKVENQNKREQIFIDILESLSKSEIAILSAIKEQSLSNLYPNITKKLYDALVKVTKK